MYPPKQKKPIDFGVSAPSFMPPSAPKPGGGGGALAGLSGLFGGQGSQGDGEGGVSGFLNSPLMGSIIQAGGAGLSAYGQNKANDQQMKQNAQQFGANMQQRQLENSQQLQLGQAKGAADASPLGANQNFAAKNAMLMAILPGLRNVKSTPGDPAVAAAMGSRSGGLQLPQGGLDPAMIERMFGDLATQTSIAHKEKQVGQINPNNPVYDMGSLYGNSADGSENAFMSDIRNSNNNVLTEQNTEAARAQEAIQRAIDNDIAGEKQQKDKEKEKGTPWWKKLAKVAAMAAPIVAAPFTGGASLAAIGALSGAAGGALNGGGLKGALMGGALGGATAGFGGGSGAKATSIGAGLKTAAKNPALAQAVLGGLR